MSICSTLPDVLNILVSSMLLGDLHGVRVTGVLGVVRGADSHVLDLVHEVEGQAGGDEERPQGLDDGSGPRAKTEESHWKDFRDEGVIGRLW